VKFGLPMAFTVTMMAWSIIEYGKQMASSGELGHAMDAVKWGTDYFIKAHPEPYVLYGEVLYCLFLIEYFTNLYLLAFYVLFLKCLNVIRLPF
jgi:Glycosyl hydrolase family 9